MATYLENLVIIRDNYAQSLATESALQISNGPKPSYSIDGQSVNWDAWRDSMMAKIAALNELLAAGEPFELHSVGYN